MSTETVLLTARQMRDQIIEDAADAGADELFAQLKTINVFVPYVGQRKIRIAMAAACLVGWELGQQFEGSDLADGIGVEIPTPVDTAGTV